MRTGDERYQDRGGVAYRDGDRPVSSSSSARAAATSAVPLGSVSDHVVYLGDDPAGISWSRRIGSSTLLALSGMWWCWWSRSTGIRGGGHELREPWQGSTVDQSLDSVDVVGRAERIRALHHLTRSACGQCHRRGKGYWN